MTYRFFVDAETDGLYGRFLSVAILVTDEKGNEVEHFYGAVAVEADEISSPWVLNNVFPHLDNAETVFKSENELLEAVWGMWIKYRERAECIADVASPVEARLFARCVQQNLKEREFLAPFPLYDLSSVFRAKGFSWDTDRNSFCGIDRPAHDAMNDVKIIAANWHKLMSSN